VSIRLERAPVNVDARTWRAAHDLLLCGLLDPFTERPVCEGCRWEEDRQREHDREQARRRRAAKAARDGKTDAGLVRLTERLLERPDLACRLYEALRGGRRHG
jgi:hypothetical protein